MVYSFLHLSALSFILPSILLVLDFLYPESTAIGPLAAVAVAAASPAAAIATVTAAAYCCCY